MNTNILRNKFDRIGQGINWNNNAAVNAAMLNGSFNSNNLKSAQSAGYGVDYSLISGRDYGAAANAARYGAVSDASIMVGAGGNGANTWNYNQYANGGDWNGYTDNADSGRGWIFGGGTNVGGNVGGSSMGGGTNVTMGGSGTGTSGTNTSTQTTGTTTVTTTTTVQGSTFSRFLADDIIAQQTEVVTGGVWSTGVASLTTHWSSSAQTTSQRRYYVEVYDSNPSSTDSVAQYSIAYGHALGSGSDSQGQLNDSPSRAIYSQFRNLLLPQGTSRFTTQGSGSTNSIYAISFNRNRLKERLDPGNFEIPLQTISSRATNASGSVVVSGAIHTLIDDSSINTGSFTATGGRVYNLVSGSIANGVFNSAAPVYYGVVYPDYGTVILDGNVLDLKLAFDTKQQSSTENNNHFALFRSISGSGTVTNGASGDKYGFQARNSEKVTSTHYFVRVKNGQFNYSNNPTYVTGSTGDINNSFLTDPVTYITTIGLYNDQQELLAVAKVSKPILKSFSKESLIRVKLDF